MSEKMMCIKCGDHPIVNKTYKLCFWCNFKRLHDGLSYRQYIYLKQKESSLKRLKKAQNDILLMEEVYEKVFISQPNRCQECGCILPNNFRDKGGRVIMKSQYSHILPKSVYPEHKYNHINFNRLCQDDHIQWENGDRRNMKIWQDNIKIPVIGEILLKNR